MNFMQRRAFRARAVNALVNKGWNRRDARQSIQDLGDDEIIDCCTKVAVTKGVAVPVGAFGDGTLINWFIDFWAKYGDEIIAMILMLFGL
jgi:hypothetical protein